MKRGIILIWTFSVIVVGCVNKEFDPETWDINKELTLSEYGLAFSSGAGRDTIVVNSNYTFYSVDVLDNEDGTSPSWCTVTKEEKFGLIIVNVEPNISSEQRKAKIRVRIGRGTYFDRELFVIQMGGQWDVMGQFSLFLSHNISETQRAALSDLLNNMVYVEGGSFYMGCQNENPLGINYVSINGISNNIHEVTLDGFYISPFEVTQDLWQSIMANNPSTTRKARKPVDNISWNDAVSFCNTLSKLTSLSVALPTEAQWEYAARGGKNSQGYVYPGSNSHEDVAYSGNDGMTVVGSKHPNELGLYDMAGNVAEYCMDFYAEEYPTVTMNNPIGPSVGSEHVVRGGSFNSWSGYFCSSARDYGSSNGTEVCSNTGFRIVIRP